MKFINYKKIKKCQFKFLFNLFVFTLLLLCNINLTFAVDSQSSEKSLVISADVFISVKKLNQDIDILRHHMGVNSATLMDLRVSRAAPQDVYFQALTMFNKINLLSFEITRQEALPPPIPPKNILPSHFIILVNNSHEVLQSILESFKIHKIHSENKLDFSKTPSDVFKMIMLTNRQLNLLLEKRFSPIDVYLRFLDCLEIISQIYNIVGLKALYINTDNINHDVITPSDVFDIA